MSAAQVILQRCHDYDPAGVAGAVRRQFDLLGGLKRFVKPGDSVLLKPNFIAPRSPKRAPAQTHPTIIVEVARLLKDYGAKPFVADSPAWADAATCAEVLGLTGPLSEIGVPVKELGHPVKRSLGPGLPRARISSVALEADAIINLPKFKAHQQLLTTFAVKNMFGCVTGKRKAMWHFRKGTIPSQFCQLLIGIYRHLAPALTIIDAIVAMEGRGPIGGTHKPLGWLIGGTDPIACETVCCRLVDIEPDRVPILRTARAIDFGCADLDQIEILGEPLPAEPCRDFELPELGPIRFSLTHVCRSVARQILIRLRGGRPKTQPTSY